MIATIRGELVKLLRRRVLAITAVTTAVFAVATAAIVLISADDGVRRVSGRGVTVASLSNAGGGTDVFTTAVSFAGVFVFVVFIGLFAMEFSRGTFRTMLMYQPRRIRLLAGKLTALLAFSAAVLAAAEIITWLAARVLAPTQDLATGSWVSLDALGQAVSDYGSVLFWVSGYALLGAALAVVVRSVPLALLPGAAARSLRRGRHVRGQRHARTGHGCRVHHRGRRDRSNDVREARCDRVMPCKGVDQGRIAMSALPQPVGVVVTRASRTAGPGRPGPACLLPSRTPS
jgi:ABC-2 type transport system permease protein